MMHFEMIYAVCFAYAQHGMGPDRLCSASQKERVGPLTDPMFVLDWDKPDKGCLLFAFWHRVRLVTELWSETGWGRQG